MTRGSSVVGSGWAWRLDRRALPHINTHSMAASDLSGAEFGAALDALGLRQNRVARLFNVTPRHVRRWRSGDRRVPHGIRIIFHLLTTRVITTDQVEQAAAISEPPAPVEPVSAPAALACAEAATHADPGSATVAAVLALAEERCHWPIGTPGASGFSFCCAPASAGSPYCTSHMRLAHTARPLPKARPGFRPSTALAGSLTPVDTHTLVEGVQKFALAKAR